LINNIELFGIDIQDFSRKCQHGVAASTSISEVPGKKSRELLIQGNQVDYVAKMLQGLFCLSYFSLNMSLINNFIFQRSTRFRSGIYVVLKQVLVIRKRKIKSSIDDLQSNFFICVVKICSKYLRTDYIIFNYEYLKLYVKTTLILIVFA
jgi:hypothetical protein